VDFANLGELGNSSESILAKALQEIDEVSSKKDLRTKFPIDFVAGSSLDKAAGGRLIFRDMPYSLINQFKFRNKSAYGKYSRLYNYHVK